ncbi:DUF2490 domain-containing protein [Flaviaesturariibacter aridisoli]|uniref:DUF2490 domain-containing protein n=1 Tax=Flaviaesturariibacter aridisoli TaxID=2545761 RepID=A0A4R4E5Y5_9BACT|nr:DUF2490 domain-containing protein [Flaviaesturariibacter aridisoli]TCZ73451.1 DUF2490 domain-containing protein [Flaviaesturariibacter aridisoli]
MKQTSFLAFLLACGALSAGAQAKIRTQSTQAWVGYFNQTRLSDRWGLWLEGQLRTQDDLVDGLSQSILRGGLTYYLADNTKATAGYAFVNHFPADNHPDVSQPEHRVWQQVQWHTRYRRLRTMQWFRLEERYRRRIAADGSLGEGHQFNYRARYNFLLQMPLAPEVRKGTVSLIANNEVMVNFGKEIVTNYFDQNRAFLGAAFNLNAADNIQAGYLNVFQQLGTPGRYRTLHTARLSFFHNLDLRKKNRP